MRRCPPVAFAACALVLGAALALLVAPATQSAQLPERVVFDATVQVIPPHADPPCMRLEAGVLTTRAVLTGEGRPVPAALRVAGYESFQVVVDAELELSREEVATSLPLDGGIWCWKIDATLPPGVTVAERSIYVQYVDVKMTLAPR